MSLVPETSSSAAAPTPGRAGSQLDPLSLGTALALVSALAYTGANLALRRLADRDDLDWAVWVSCIKAVPATLAALAVMGWAAARGRPALPPRRVVLPLVLTGLFMQFGGNVTFQWALSLGGLAVTVPLTFATLIVSGAVCGRIYLLEPVTLRSAGAMGLLIASIVLLSAGAEEAAASLVERTSGLTVAGAVLAAGMAGIAYGTSGVVIRRTLTARVPLAATLFLLSASGGIGLGLTSLVQLGPAGILRTRPDELWLMSAAGAMNAVAFFAVSAALKFAPVVRVNLLNASQIAMCAAAGVAFFREPATGWLVAGTLLTVAGLLTMDNRRPAFDLDRIVAETFARRVEFRPRMRSTSDRALELAVRQDVELPLLVLAERQTSGRGRGANRWWSSPGGLTFSLVLNTGRLNLPAALWPRVSLTAGLAVCEVLRDLLRGGGRASAPEAGGGPGGETTAAGGLAAESKRVPAGSQVSLAERPLPSRPRVSLKWPNDVLLDGRKICGILVEVPAPREGRLVVGIGLNVNNSLHRGPAELRQTATSLLDATGRRFDATAVLIALLRRLERELAELAARPDRLRERWESVCWLRGRRIHLDTPRGRVAGACLGIDADGALLLETERGPERLLSGAVVRLED